MPDENQNLPQPSYQSYQFPVEPPESDGLPPRHGCLTAWLAVSLALHGFGVLLNCFAYPLIHRALPGFTPLVAGLLAAAGLGSVVCVAALFRWKRWGFYGLIVITLLSFVVNVAAGVSPARALAGLLGIGVLYWVLNMGGRESAWQFLE